ncbi:MAG: tRNA 2-thiouridine(34) synthase MnmA [Acidobacteriota bacterium]
MNNKKNKVLVAMSGGVDSSVAAALLKQKGFEVVGIYMRMLPDAVQKNNDRSKQISALAASFLGIEHFSIDLSQKFKSQIIGYFIKEYSRGRTPNPCVKCNPFIKFDALLEESKKIEADCIATGHYIRIKKKPDSPEFYIKKGRDKKKDQSYFLYLLTQKHIKRALMPLGDKRKEWVIKKAQELNLPAVPGKESQEICFIPDNDYVSFIKKAFLDGFKQGPILDTKGSVLGEHQGYARFTVGQRRGLGIAASRPLYVLEINPKTNTVVVGPEENLYKKTLTASKINWISGQTLKYPLKVKAQIRYNHNPQEAVVRPIGSELVQVEFQRSQRAITPGQSVVFYDGDVLLGGGTIIKSQA